MKYNRKLSSHLFPYDVYFLGGKMSVNFVPDLRGSFFFCPGVFKLPIFGYFLDLSKNADDKLFLLNINNPVMHLHVIRSTKKQNHRSHLIFTELHKAHKNH